MGPQECHEATGTTGAPSRTDLHTETTPETDGSQPRPTLSHQGFSGREGAHFRKVPQRSTLRQASQNARSPSYKTTGKYNNSFYEMHFGGHTIKEIKRAKKDDLEMH